MFHRYIVLENGLKNQLKNARIALYMNKDEQIGVLLTKGVEAIIPSTDFLKKELSSGKVLTIYAGFDPTAPTLHIGHSIGLRKLRQFQDLGHKIIFLIGDFTARIGDPDKLSARKPLSEKEIKSNLKLYKKQASKFIRFSGKNAAKVKFNNSWLGKMKFADVLNLASQMTVEQMLKRDMFARRIEEQKPIYIHEFMYPLMQGYDSVAMGVDGEVGGNDQLFNMLAGRTLLKSLKNKEKFVITTKLLEDSTGAKMGKTTGNMISLIDSPVEMYGKIMSWTDGLIVPGFELCTDYTPSQVENISEELKKGINPRDVKMKLAFEITKICSSEKEAQKAQESFVLAFQKKEIPDEITELFAEIDLAQTLLKSELVVSNSDIRRLVMAHAITHLESNQTMSIEDIKKSPKKGTYKIGKNRFIKIV
jgi:tyrosyl-tRNA synthetase